ncbi:hypothetical protein H5410_040868 [Solanum commersonii]|uniref:Uncharacterized protein n=1 Tax=Solanum commersonii TaxID=4109 RepID=A0A9J5XRD6_SOLCO|nr:hypothetical protein H5410_040868 [Solanum commersonii]
MIGINHAWVRTIPRNILSPICQCVVVNMYIETVVLALISLPQCPIMILLLFVMLARVMKRRILNKRCTIYF